MRSYLIAALLLFIFPQVGISGEAVGTSTQLVLLDPNNTGLDPRLLFSVSGPHVNRPACATVPSRFAIDLTTKSGQEFASVVKMAHATGMQINVIGRGTCTIWGDTESVATLFISP